MAGSGFVVATARPIRGVRDFLPWVRYDIGIFHNGAVICEADRKIGEIGIESPVSLVSGILKQEPDCAIAIEANDNMYANFDMEEIVAFGDDYNDIEMLRACGTGVAVGNALAEVKQAADEVCLTNEEDGVALWLTEHVLREDWVRKNLYH